MSSKEMPAEGLIPFDLSEFRKEPERLRSISGRKAIEAVEMRKANKLSVIWDGFNKNQKHMSDKTYDLFFPHDLTLLRLASDEVELKIRIWRGQKGQPLIWGNFTAPAVSPTFPEGLPDFTGWASEEVVIKVKNVNLDPEIAACTKTVYMLESSDMYSVPKGDVFIHWGKALEKNPNAVVQLRHMLWFFGGNEYTLTERIQAGQLPKPTPPAVPKKHVQRRRWLLSEVAKFKHQFVGAAKGTLSPGEKA